MKSDLSELQIMAEYWSHTNPDLKDRMLFTKWLPNSRVLKLAFRLWQKDDFQPWFRVETEGQAAISNHDIESWRPREAVYA